MRRSQKTSTEIVRATRRITAIQSVQELGAATESFNEAQVYALKAIASFVRPAEILTALDEYVQADKLTRAWVEKQSSPAKRADRCRAIIEYFRRQAQKEMGEIPIANPVYRLRELQNIADTTQDERVKIVALKEAHSQTEDFNKRAASAPGMSWEDWIRQMNRPMPRAPQPTDTRVPSDRGETCQGGRPAKLPDLPCPRIGRR